jgi:hypothetical protein
MWWVVNATLRPLYPWERSGTHCMGGWVGPTAGLDGCVKSRPSPGFRPVRSSTISTQTSKLTPPPIPNTKPLNTVPCCTLRNPFHIAWTLSHSHALTCLHSIVRRRSRHCPRPYRTTTATISFNVFFLSNATTCPCGLRGLPSWAWQWCNRLLRSGRPWGAVTLSRWCEWWYRRMECQEGP